MVYGDCLKYGNENVVGMQKHMTSVFISENKQDRSLQLSLA